VACISAPTGRSWNARRCWTKTAIRADQQNGLLRRSLPASASGLAGDETAVARVGDERRVLGEAAVDA
jgi:hypothetical protein